MADVRTGVAAGTGAAARADTGADAMADVRNEDMARLLGMMKATGRNSYEYLSRPLVRVCPVCGEVFETSGRGRPRKFCSAACRMKYHHSHPKPENWKSTRVAVCPVCGKEFLASREYSYIRKYCSHACANKGRAMKAGAPGGSEGNPESGAEEW